MTGKVAPDSENPVPAIAPELIVNGAVPVEVIVTGSVAIEPTVTLPKLRLVELTKSWGFSRAIPVVVKRITVDGFVEESVLSVRVPVASPVVRAVDCILSVTFC